MKTSLRLSLLASMVLSASTALADGKAACLAAASSGQTQRDAHNLIEAREQFRVCAQVQCPGVVRTDCTDWLDAVEKSIATVVVTAKDDSGADLFDVNVRLDGKPLLGRLDGRAVAVNPGLRTFHFDFPDGASLDQPVMVKEGEKNQTVFVVSKRRPPATEPLVPTPPGVSAGSSTPSASGGSSAWKTIGWVLGGTGIVGLAVGSAFGVTAIGDKNKANCDANNYCDAGPLSSARQAATASSVGFIAGGVLLAGGAALVLFGPTDHHEGTGALQVTPMLGKNGGAISIGGRWQ
jgi:hypothetical protein